jgi:Mn2+/Fe2+ NRAMP family transporter
LRPVKKIFEIALGIVTSIGGFLEAGSIATAAQAGNLFSYRLLWVIVFGTLCIIMLSEMAGRLAAVSHHPLPSAVRERFGFRYYVMPLVAETILDFLVLASEIGGCCVALQLMTGIAFPFWALPVAIVIWLVLWLGSFGTIEYGVSTLGLVTLVFVVAAIKLHPEWSAAARAALPTFPHHDKPQYWFLAVSIFGATVSPYLLNFYSSGAVEDEWDESDLWPNRVTSALGMGFGGMVSIAVLIGAACVLHPRGIHVDSYEQVAQIVTQPLGKWGYWIFCIALFIACFGASLELSLDIAYVYAQTFGWSWGENKKPYEAARFSAVFSIFVFAASILMLAGIDPIKLTMFSMAVTAIVLPVVILPFLVLMNDKQFVGEHRNGWFANTFVFALVMLSFVIALVAIPLQIMGGS